MPLPNEHHCANVRHNQRCYHKRWENVYDRRSVYEIQQRNWNPKRTYYWIQIHYHIVELRQYFRWQIWNQFVSHWTNRQFDVCILDVHKAETDGNEITMVDVLGSSCDFRFALNLVSRSSPTKNDDADVEHFICSLLAKTLEPNHNMSWISSTVDL